MAITPLPAVPLRSDAPATFVAKADAFLGALNLFATEVDEVGVALTLGATNSTSTTSLLIGLGSKSLTVQTGKSYVVGMTVKIASTATGVDWMLGDITSYTTGTGALVVTVTSISGSGTLAAWTVSQSAPGGAQVGANADITSLSGLTTPLSVAQGGTGQNTPIGTSRILPITASVAANALTCTLNPTTLDFRNTPLTSGAINTRSVATAISVVVPSTATLGTVSTIQSRLILLALDNAGTVELAVVNIAGGVNLDETTLISTTAISAAATSASVVYSTTARTSLPFRVVGYVESTQATAGTWATAPSTIQGQGGQALAAMSSLGYGQTWQDVTASRTPITTYYNNTGKPIFVSVSAGNAGSTIQLTINGVVVCFDTDSVAGVVMNVNGVVPPSGSYSLSISSTLSKWLELR